MDRDERDEMAADAAHDLRAGNLICEECLEPAAEDDYWYAGELFHLDCLPFQDVVDAVLPGRFSTLRPNPQRNAEAERIFGALLALSRKNQEPSTPRPPIARVQPSTLLEYASLAEGWLKEGVSTEDVAARLAVVMAAGVRR